MTIRMHGLTGVFLFISTTDGSGTKSKTESSLWKDVLKLYKI